MALGALLISLWLTLLAAPASAHDSLTGSEPAEGEVLTVAPDALVLTYSGEISDLGAQFMVTGPEGRDVVQGTPTVEGAVVTQELADELVDGDYEVAWRVTSSDGHPISGTITFSIAADDASRSDDRGAATAGPEGEATTTDATPGAAPSPTPTTDPAPATGDSGTADQAEVTADAADPDVAEPASGIPAWGWLVAALAAVGLVACGFLAFRRS